MCAAIARIGESSMTATSLVGHRKMEQGREKSKKPAKSIRTRRTFKVIIIGDPNVGKTCLSFRFCNGRFPAKTEATIGVDFRERQLEMDGELIKVQLWDTAGQERFRQSMVSHYYRNVHAVVFVYDMTKSQTFTNLMKWINECSRHNIGSMGDEEQRRREVPMILVGNKCDISDDVQVDTNDAQKFADQHDMPLFETSAMMESQADHVESIFMTLVHKLKESKCMHVQTEEERQHYKLTADAQTGSGESSCFGNC